MVKIRERSGGCVFPVKVQPGARKDQVAGEWNGAFKIKLAAAPVDGQANQSLIAALSRAIGVPKSSISIVRGERSRMKVVSVLGVSAARIAARLGSASSPDTFSRRET